MGVFVDYKNPIILVSACENIFKLKTIMTDEKKKSVKGSGKIELKLLDEQFEELLIRYIDGANYTSVALELKELQLDPDQKRALFRAGLAAAIGNRRTLLDVAPREMSIVSGIKGFTLNNMILMSKLTIIGHSILRTDKAGKIGSLWRAKLNGAASIYEANDLSKFSEKRIKVFEAIKMKRIFDISAADDIVKILTEN